MLLLLLLKCTKDAKEKGENESGAQVEQERGVCKRQMGREGCLSLHRITTGDGSRALIDGQAIQRR